MEFAWDEEKNRINKRKHGVSFETASLIFDDPHHLTRQDRGVDGEPRWQTIGVVRGIHMLLVAHTVVARTVNEYDEEIRIGLGTKTNSSRKELICARQAGSLKSSEVPDED